MKVLTSLLAVLVLSQCTPAPENPTLMNLWPDSPPHFVETTLTEDAQRGEDGILRIKKVTVPTLEVYQPEPDGTERPAVLIFPGGGYHILAYEHEGTHLAQWLAQRGVVAGVVKYRLPTTPGFESRHKVPLADAHRAVRLMRHLAADWGVDTARVGVLGFSAGGHLASTVCLKSLRAAGPLADAVDGHSAKPDFAVLVYPVVTLVEPFMHQGSRNALLGKLKTDSTMAARYSAEKQATADFPPTLLIHSVDDEAVPIENSRALQTQLRRQGVATKLVELPTGGHGFGMATEDPQVIAWLDHVLPWINSLPRAEP